MRNDSIDGMGYDECVWLYFIAFDKYEKQVTDCDQRTVAAHM